MGEIFWVFFLTGILGVVLVLANKILGPKRSSALKDSPFECGSPYLQDRIPPVPIKYYLVAFLFLLFDVEVVFFYPWALVFRKLSGTALISMAAYVLILGLGFVYAWKKGAFQWEK